MLARLGVVVLLVLAGCAPAATLPYKPDPQPRGARVSAAYQVVGDRLRIELDTGGRRLEQAWIRKPDGSSVAPEAVDNPAVVTGPGSSVGVGVGGGYGGRVGVGTGVSMGFPIGTPPTRTQGNTVVWFPAATAGTPPWQLYVKLAGTDPTQFPVGGPLPQ